MTNQVIFPSLENNEVPLAGTMDMAGMATEMQAMIPDINLLPLYCLNLKIEQDALNIKLDKLIKFLKAKGLSYE